LYQSVNPPLPFSFVYASLPLPLSVFLVS
jgi:hypothetical protein